jgi:hypothetical protein
VRSNPCLYLNRTIQKIGPELYIDVTPVAGKGKKHASFGTTAPSIGRKSVKACFYIYIYITDI